jgi:hypothetical protein
VDTHLLAHIKHELKSSLLPREVRKRGYFSVESCQNLVGHGAAYFSFLDVILFSNLCNLSNGAKILPYTGKELARKFWFYSLIDGFKGY